MEEKNDYRRGRHVVSAMHVHLVFVTKYRRGVFNDETLTRCEEIMREVCTDFEAELKQFNAVLRCASLIPEGRRTAQDQR